MTEVRCTCPECGHEFEEEVEIDPGDFYKKRKKKRN